MPSMMRKSEVTTRMYNVDWGVSVLGLAANISPTEPQHNSTIQIMDRIRQKHVSMQRRVRFSGRRSHITPDSRHRYLRFSSTMYWY